MVSIYFVISIIAVVNLSVGVKGLMQNSLVRNYGLATDKVLTNKEYGRLWSASWIHTHWSHLLFNALMLLGIGWGTNWPIAASDFLFLYLTCQLGGNLLALFTYRDDQSGQYDAIGMAGGISGVLFASIALYPSLSVSMPVLGSIPAWSLAITFLVVSVFALKPYSSTMIHDAHLGGAIVGLLLTPLIAPEALADTLWIAVGTLVPTVVLFYTLVKAPDNIVPRTFLQTDSKVLWKVPELEVQDTLASDYETVEDEINALLDKISEEGYQNLSDYERERLRNISGKAGVSA